MKDARGRKLTRKQKIIMSEKVPNLRADNWLCIEDNHLFFKIQHRLTKSVKTIGYPRGGRNV
ncbi:MAG: DUF6906 family protein [Candidatus Ornithomonoglobus sp.]